MLNLQLRLRADRRLRYACAPIDDCATLARRSTTALRLRADRRLRYACAPIDDCATLRRRSAPLFQYNEPENSTGTWKSVNHVPRRFCYLTPRPVSGLRVR